MGESTKIEWCDHTFNPWIGCSKVHAGCANCYAEDMMDHRYGKAKWGPRGTRVLTSDANWKQPLKWNRDAAKAGARARVFCASLADVFENWTGTIRNANGETLFRNPNGGGRLWMDTPFGKHSATMDDIRRELFALIDATPHLDWLLLTKRPDNIREMWNAVDDRPAGNLQKFRENVWLGTSISDQASANKQVADIIKCRHLARVLFLSIEPLLGPVDIPREWLELLDWVIVGGESGPNARPMHPDWARSIRDQCVAAGLPFFFKQWGEWMPVFHGIDPNIGDPNCRIKAVHAFETGGFPEKGLPRAHMWRVGKKAAGRLLDGREWNQFPEVKP